MTAASPGGRHLPVLYHEVLAGLQPEPGGKYIDGTLGAGGHAAGILAAASPEGRLLGLDRDPAALDVARAVLARFGDLARLVRASYVEMASVARAGWPDFVPVDGILLDLGLSSLQLDDPARGFAFQTEGPLDMRFDPGEALTAGEIVNTWPESELADILYRYGEEPQGRRIARAIASARPVRSTRELAELIARAAGGERRGVVKGARRPRIHPATRTFQALRIAVNGELEAVDQVLPIAVGLLRRGGRLAVISFHSLEDRLVKTFFRRLARGDPERDAGLPVAPVFVPELVEVTRKPVVASEAEIALNPRARSARLRVAEKI